MYLDFFDQSKKGKYKKKEIQRELTMKMWNRYYQNLKFILFCDLGCMFTLIASRLCAFCEYAPLSTCSDVLYTQFFPFWKCLMPVTIIHLHIQHSKQFAFLCYILIIHSLIVIFDCIYNNYVHFAKKKTIVKKQQHLFSDFECVTCTRVGSTINCLNKKKSILFLYFT